MDTFGDEPNPKGKPAILTAMGTVSRVTMTERANPPAKPSVMHSKLVAGRKDTLMSKWSFYSEHAENGSFVGSQ